MCISYRMHVHLLENQDCLC